ncbi:hypothetical protein CNY89_12280 [Amaricoccus sp. HAR-UPW-R2A-40]|nr:hypothetical protein CNY89_12280 [Amaricoccus sp. HAR-UPW-R2A-40]
MAFDRKSLAEITKTAAGPQSRKDRPQEPQQAVTVTRVGAVGQSDVRPSRNGKAFVGGYFPLEVRRQIKVLAAEQDKTVQQLAGEALNLLFATYGKGEIAPTERE